MPILIVGYGSACDTNLSKSNYFKLVQIEVLLNCTNFDKNVILWGSIFFKFLLKCQSGNTSFYCGAPNLNIHPYIG